eukprot:jgi/Chlat1/1502/Chrsp12S02044
MLHICAKMDDLQRARQIYNDAAKATTTLSRKMYHLYIHVLARHRLMDEGFTVAEDMVKAGFEPDMVTFWSLSHAAGMTGRIDAVRRIRKWMNRVGWGKNSENFGMSVVRPAVEELLRVMRVDYAAVAGNKGRLVVPHSALYDYAERRESVMTRQRAVRSAMLRYAAIAGIGMAACMLPRLLSLY